MTEQVELWMPSAGMERGCLTREDIDRLTKQRMESLGLSEEFLTSRCDVGVSLFEAAHSNRIRASNMHLTAMRGAFERTYKRIMSPRLFCRAVPGGAMLFGVRFRSLRKARVAFKAQIKHTAAKTLKLPMIPVTEYGS